MKDAQICRQKMTLLLQSHNSKINAANDYLLAIRKSISENSLDTLYQSLADPQLPVDEIQALEQQRHQLLEEYGFASDHAGFEECVAWCDDESGRVSDLYQLLVKNLLELQHVLQVNSLLVSKGKDRIRRSIGILTGVGKGSDLRGYSSKGESIQQIGSRDIAVA